MISITCIDALNYTPTIKALESTLSCIPNVSKIYWFSDVDLKLDNVPVTWIKINRFKKYTEEYNYITLKLIPHIVTEPYNIIIHSDGFAVNRDAWDNDFLKYDYIGAVWPWETKGYNVGNGGFSLRSRKLYDAFLDMDIKWKTSQFPKEIIDSPSIHVYDVYNDMVVPEDNIICKIYRDSLEKNYGIKFAEADVADKFSIEHNLSSFWLGKSLGFHGKHGIAEHYGVKL